MKIEKIVAGMMPTNGYIVYDEVSKEGYIIDPDGHYNEFLSKVVELDINVKAIILTHFHYDHIGAVEGITFKLNCDVFIHEAERDEIVIKIHHFLKTGDEIAVGDKKLVVLHTPGHTEGSICLYCEEERLAFTGDTLFNTEIGRVDLPCGSSDNMINSLKNIVAKWADDVVIYPGHGESADMAFVRENNEEYKYVIEKL